VCRGSFGCFCPGQDRCRSSGHLIVITALTEIIVLMGFVIAFMINAANT
jgi:F0F1-type ATP synthase membrane subunit c/vacuolar-type H+-ATPase subunit K